MKSKAILKLLLALLACAAPAVQAAEDCGPDQELCVPVGTWEVKLGVGLGMRSNPLVGGDDIPIVLVPHISYYGKRFFIDYLDVGYTLLDRRDLMVNAILTPGSDGLFFFENGWRNAVLDGGIAPGLVSSPSSPPNGSPTGGDSEPPEDYVAPEPPKGRVSLKNVHERHLSGMAGLELISRPGAWDIELQLLSDVTGVHHGEEVRLNVGTSKSFHNNVLGVAVGVNWKSASLLNYYYGVGTSEVSDPKLAYSAGSGVSPFARVAWSQPISENWRWLASVQYQQLGSAMRDSPLVEDGHVVQVFVGGIYNF